MARLIFYVRSLKVFLSFLRIHICLILRSSYFVYSLIVILTIKIKKTMHKYEYLYIINIVSLYWRNPVRPPAHKCQYATQKTQYIGHDRDCEARIVVHAVDGQYKQLRHWYVVLWWPHVQCCPTIALYFPNKQRPFRNNDENLKRKKIRIIISFEIKLVIVLVFYDPSTHFRSIRARLVNLSTLFWASLLGSLPVLNAHSFASN